MLRIGLWKVYTPGEYMIDILWVPGPVSTSLFRKLLYYLISAIFTCAKYLPEAPIYVGLTRLGVAQ
jgi:hypothetical protein